MKSIEKNIHHDSIYNVNPAKNEDFNFHEKILKCVHENHLHYSGNEFLEKLALYSPNTLKENLHTPTDELITITDDANTPLDDKELCLLIFLNAFMARMLQPDYLLSYDDDD
ncbi:hypothetical protein [Pectobacterium versatile]|uniref:hypothetical protein n=1 Tax=Pectobacterium versatile TaxID=2488639 RepID=UPI001CCDE53E|nr:hypothetical protein [Pectobacterium versatile]